MGAGAGAVVEAGAVVGAGAGAWVWHYQTAGLSTPYRGLTVSVFLSVGANLATARYAQPKAVCFNVSYVLLG